MRTVVAYPGLMAHAQQSARAIMEAGCLAAFVTTYVYRPEDRLGSLLSRVPGDPARAAMRHLARRTLTEVPPGFVRAYPAWELLRVLAGRAGAGEIVVDKIWDRMSHSFDARVASRHVPDTAAVMAFEYTALAAFAAARRHGVARILQLPSRDSRESEEIQRREEELWPQLVRRGDTYFDDVFARRYERRQREIADADLIVANSNLTARSHVKAGADSARMAVVPLAAPPPLDPAALSFAMPDRPLTVLWAGSFSLRKGAHYLLDAWKGLKAGSAARLEVYGQVHLQKETIASLAGSMDQIVFHGSVPQTRLYEAYRDADILVVPTLSDGFGMVVLEAMAHGLPVIVTDQAGVADCVTPSSGFVVPAADSAALSDALRHCLDDRGRLAAMRHGALETARRRQWTDYRRDLVATLDIGLRRAGYAPAFGPVP